MQLSLSSGALPGSVIGELLQACAARGFSGLELVSGDAHGISPLSPAGDLTTLRSEAAALGVRIAAYRALHVAEARSPLAARFSAALEAPVITPTASFMPEAMAAVVQMYADEGGTLLFSLPPEPGRARSLAEAVSSRAAATVGLAWDAHPGVDHLAGAAEILTLQPRPRYIRLHGGGPEAARQEGQGVGALLARLALAGYSGPLVLTPSTSAYHYAWRAWLGRTGGWGCGNKKADNNLVQLSL